MKNSVSFCKKYFDLRAKSYGRYVKTYTDPKLYKLMLKPIIEIFGKNKKLTVLDAGCGVGLSTLHLKEQGHDIWYMDFSEEMIKRGISLGIIPANRYIIHDLNAIPWPFSSNRFDLIVMRYVFHDIKDKDRILMEIKRILRPGGVLQIVDMYAKNSIDKEFYNEIHGWKTIFNHKIQCYILTEQEYIDLLKHSSFRIITKSYYTSYVSTKDWIQEGQITEERAQFIRQLIQRYITKYPELKKEFNIDFRENDIEFGFPILVITARKE